MSQPLLSLVVMVKNEAHCIVKTLDSARHHVDRVTVLDTGSTDGTQDVIRKWFKDRDIPGALHEEPFVDYATSRNRALELDRDWPTRYSLFLSADETLEGGPALRDFLATATDDAYCVTMRTGDRVWPYTRVLRTGGDWRYQGAIHERPVGPQGEEAKLIPGVVVTHAPTDPERKVKRLREYDLPQLERIASDETRSLADRTHALFFLAETHASLAGECVREGGGEPRLDGAYYRHAFTAMGLYLQYALLVDRVGEERDRVKGHYALFLHYHLADSLRPQLYSSAEMMERMGRLSQVAPEMAEVRFLLAKHAAFIEPRRGLHLALECAKVARAALDSPRYEARDVSIEWRAYSIAAWCAEQMKNPTRAKELAERGIAAGGPREAFETYLRGEK